MVVLIYNSSVCWFKFNLSFYIVSFLDLILLLRCYSLVRFCKVGDVFWCFYEFVFEIYRRNVEIWLKIVFICVMYNYVMYLWRCLKIFLE